MRFASWLMVLAACGGSRSTCPTVDELMREGAIRREIEIVVQRCRADSWSASVVKCMKDAKDDAAMEPCFKALSKDQKNHLERAFAPISAEYDAKDKQEQRAGEKLFQEELAAMHLEKLSARAPACGEYRAALADVLAALGRCEARSSQLEMFGVQQAVKKQVGALVTIEDDAALGAACARDAETVRGWKPAC